MYSFFPFSNLPTLSALNRYNFNDIDVITDIGTNGTISFVNIATTQIIMNKDNFNFLQNNTNKDYNNYK